LVFLRNVINANKKETALLVSTHFLFICVETTYVILTKHSRGSII